MAKNKTQPKIEAFLQELTQICQKHGMCVDANGGGGRRGEGKDRGEARFNEGCPLVLYAQSGGGSNFRKVGYLWYSFLGQNEDLTYNFDPKVGTPYSEVIIPDPVEEIEDTVPEQPTTIKKARSSALTRALEQAKEWQKEKNIN